MEIGIDIGGTKIAAGIVREGHVVRRIIVPTPHERAACIRQLREIIAQLSADRTGRLGKRARIGIGVPGFYKGTRITLLPHVPALEGVDLRRALGCPVVLENDARCFALAEAHYGAGKGKRSMLGLTLGTGVGGGLVVDRRLFRGNGAAGELGHAPCFWHGETLEYEGLLSGPAILARHQGTGGPERGVAEIWASSSAAAQQTREETGEALSLLVLTALCAYDPDLVVLGGSVSSPELVAHVRKRLGTRSVVLSKLGMDAGILGAALTVRAAR